MASVEAARLAYAIISVIGHSVITGKSSRNAPHETKPAANSSDDRSRRCQYIRPMWIPDMASSRCPIAAIHCHWGQRKAPAHAIAITAAVPPYKIHFSRRAFVICNPPSKNKAKLAKAVPKASIGNTCSSFCFCAASIVVR